MALVRSFDRFFATAIAELVGCYLPLFVVADWQRPGMVAIAGCSQFVGFLTLHPAASGRVYATYGAVYIATALGWLYCLDGVTPV